MRATENLTDLEQKQLRRLCADEISMYGRAYINLEMIYRGYGYEMPVECWHNFKDSWFHYKKLYGKKDKVSVFNEKYAMEEHLFRAWKDGLIFLAQEICFSLEMWYLNDKKNLKSEISSVDNSILLEVHSFVQNKEKCGDRNWVDKIFDYYSIKGDKEICRICYWYYETYISNDKELKEFQRIIHELKDLVLQIRYGGTDIYRPDHPDNYMKELLNILECLNEKLKKNGMVYLLSSSLSIFSELGIHKKLLVNEE